MNNRLYYPISLFLKITDFCPNNCMDGRYCFCSCSPSSTSWFDLSKADRIFSEARSEGIRELAYISVEPFSDLDYLEEITRKASQAGLKPRFLVTNGRIGNTIDNARTTFQRIKDSGFDISLEENYLGSGYNGIDVSVDQFHRILPEYLANTILAALDVFGPTRFVSIRTTDPAKRHYDPTTLNQTLKHLIESGRVRGVNKQTKEIVFLDGSRVIVNRLKIQKVGNATKLADDFFDWKEFREEELTEYKDLRELDPISDAPSVFHKLYLNPDGRTYPELSRLPILNGGNAYEIPVASAIENIDNNPLVSLIIGQGFFGILDVLRKLGVQPDLYTTGDLELHTRYLSQQDLMEKVQKYARESGLEDKIRSSLLGPMNEFRGFIESGGVKLRFKE